MKVLERQLVRPEGQGPSIRCGIKDVLTPVPASFAFVFDQTLDSELLSEALRGALRRYPVFAGSFRRAGKELFLDCDTRGVVFETVRHEQVLGAWMKENFGAKPGVFVDKIGFGIKPRSCVLKVRVNQFSGGGTVLGVSMNHAVADGASLGGFLKAWSDLAAGHEVASPIIPTDRPRFALENTEDSAIPSELRLLSVSELMRNVGYMARHALRSQLVMFHFGAAEVTNIRDELQSRAGTKLSRNDALVAHAMSVIQGVYPRAEGRDLLIAMNGRSRSGLPANVVGNFVTMLALPCRDGVLPEQLAAQLRGAIEAWAPNYHSLARFVDEVGGTGRAFRMAPAGLTRFDGSLFISNMIGFGLYDLSFGGAQPIYVMPLAFPFPWMAHTLESYHRTGVQLHIHVPSAIAKRLLAPATLDVLHKYRNGGDTAIEAPWLS